jgi:hypothetical protein
LTPKNGHLFEMEKILVRNWPKIGVFGSHWKPTTSVFFTSFQFVKAMLWGCQSYALSLSLVAFKRVKCHK